VSARGPVSAEVRKARVAAAKLLVFSVVSLIFTGTLVAIMGKFGGPATYDYTAIFANASMVQKGDDVRVAGVVVGRVKKVTIYDRSRAKLDFSVDKSLELTRTSRVEIRYLNLVGDRYVALEQGAPGGERLDPGGTIPIEQTQPALNLTALYDGFAPLFAALSPKDVNELSMNLVRVLQGEGGTIQGLLQHTASLTSAIADRDQLVGQVITNLNGVLGTVDAHHQQLVELVSQLRSWVGGLAHDRVQLGNSIVNISTLTRSLADLLVEGRAPLKADIAQLRTLSATLTSPAGQAVLKKILQNLPEMLADQTRTGTYGSWYNYYVCAVAANIKLPSGLDIAGLGNLTKSLQNIKFHSTAPRCQS
jgi:phospholipid/cholesterol/gamma-HCH transport system substrate-binding protein